MSKEVKLTVSRFGSLFEFSCDSVRAAAISGCVDIDSGESVPVKISENGVTAWEITPVFDDGNDKLRELAGMLLINTMSGWPNLYVKWLRLYRSPF